MLFAITGTAQTGKTRWLTNLIDGLRADGVDTYGVLAPGLWVESTNTQGEPCFEKLGFDNLLLPHGIRIPFARRRDLAKSEGSFNPESQSAQAHLGWEMSESAIAQVNSHFDQLRAAAASGKKTKRGLLVVDELGPLELKRGGGLVSALAAVEEGPTAYYEHAVVVIRESLIEEAAARFADTWNGVTVVTPGDDAAATIQSTLK